MDESSNKDIELDVRATAGPDQISIRRWFAAYACFLALTCGLMAMLLAGGRAAPAKAGAPPPVLRGPAWVHPAWAHRLLEKFTATKPEIKLLGFATYMSLCCTFLPLPTGWIVAALASREAGLAAGISPDVLVQAIATALLIGTAGATGSTFANLNDYHLFTLILRSRQVARVRDTRMYHMAARWFARSPLFIMVVFNIIPIPVDVIRVLSAIYRYPRRQFAAAVFIGRFARYGTIAFVTYWWDLGWIAVAALLGLAIVLGTIRVMPMLLRRLSSRRARS